MSLSKLTTNTPLVIALMFKNSRRELTFEQGIRLKKQRDKALREAGYSLNEGNDEERANDFLENADSKSKDARKGPSRPNYPRSNPNDKIIRQRETLQAERLRLQEERENERLEHRAVRNQSISRRREQNRMLSTKNRRGQPNLNNQIEVLLGKITKK